jgi:hypothetical protein
MYLSHCEDGDLRAETCRSCTVLMKCCEECVCVRRSLYEIVYLFLFLLDHFTCPHSMPKSTADLRKTSARAKRRITLNGEILKGKRNQHSLCFPQSRTHFGMKNCETDVRQQMSKFTVWNCSKVTT